VFRKKSKPAYIYLELKLSPLSWTQLIALNLTSGYIEGLRFSLKSFSAVFKGGFHRDANE